MAAVATWLQAMEGVLSRHPRRFQQIEQADKKN